MSTTPPHSQSNMSAYTTKPMAAPENIERPMGLPENIEREVLSRLGDSYIVTASLFMNG
jgi:hypothetical protein